MKTTLLLSALGVFAILFTPEATIAQNDPVSRHDSELVRLANPISVRYLKSKLRKSRPRLVLTPAIEKALKRELQSDPVVKNYYAAMKLNADEILEKPLLTRNVIGRRLLATSREMLYRMNILGMIYRVEKGPAILRRIDEELKAVCTFSDWNPSHFLDVAEMSLAVAIALDWAGDDLPKSTVDLARSALIEKGIKPSFSPEGVPGWVNGTNNWNQVCNGGMIAAAIVVAETDPELAAKTINRSLEGMPYALQAYGPDGLYPEGATYWQYGTSFSATTSSLLQSAFGTDFGIASYPALVESAKFRLLSVAPSGWYYNFADCGDKSGDSGDITLAWFAQLTGDALYLEHEKFLQNPEEMGKLSRLAGAGLVWLSQFENKNQSQLPFAWKGEGENPIVIFLGDDEAEGFYFGGKGGKATVSHGNMDAGSFIFELDGVRWVIDPGNQPYHELEKTGFDLWGSCQDCERWTLFTKNNFGHSTLTVNRALHVNNGFAPLIDFKTGGRPEATFDLTNVFGGTLSSATRRFVKEDDRSILIEDNFKVNAATEMITWQLMTTADVEITSEGAILQQAGKQLFLQNLSHPDLIISIISLDPSPLALDKKIDGLKRIELRMPAWLFPQGKGSIRVRLTSRG